MSGIGTKMAGLTVEFSTYDETFSLVEKELRQNK